ncbi:alpha/beta hydrolase [Candidatus Pacearchaeota archaeon]|nr:alpha/beta hydrolase [Candidatus Pacearchaeota archaeon]
MMNRIIIVHRWDGNPNDDWYPWLKKELERKNFEVSAPVMPNTSEPKIEKWTSHLKKIVGKLDEKTYFVGHSIGCQSIMRYLEKEDYEGKVGKIIFVAGWFNLDNLENEEVKKISKPWVETPINFDKVKQKISSLTVFLSDNEPHGFIEYNSRIFKNKLGAKVIIEKDKGHFTKDDGITEIEEVLKELV